MNIEYTREPVHIDPGPMLEARIIGVDGDSGAGKSRLADEIRAVLGGGQIIRADLGLDGDPDADYLGHLNMACLSNAIAIAARPIIVEGIRLLDVLDGVGVRADYMIFVRRKIVGLAFTPKARSRELDEYYRRRDPERAADLLVTTTEHWEVSARPEARGTRPRT